MSRLRFAVLAALLALSAPATAPAETVTVGNPLTDPVGSFAMCIPICTMANTKVGETGAHVTATVDGTIVRWRVKGAEGTFQLRVLHPDGLGNWVAVATSAPGTPSGAGVEVFSTSLPVQAGDLIGLDNHANADKLGFLITGGGESVAYRPPLAEGASTLGKSAIANVNEEAAFNADVEYGAVPLVSPTVGPAPPLAQPKIKKKCKKGKKLKHGKCVKKKKHHAPKKGSAH